MRFSGPCFAISTAALLMSAQLSLAADSSKRVQAGRQAETSVRTDLVAGDGAAHAGALTGHPYELTVGAARRVSEVLAPGAKPPSHDDLLRGCAVDAHNKPTCPIPSGWTLVAAQGFESGSLPPGQSFCSLTSIEATVAHSGTHAAGGNYTGGDRQDCWILSGRQIRSTITYVSFWEYNDPSLHTNEEMFLGRRTLESARGGFIADITWDMGAPGANGCLWNCADASATYTTYVEGRHPNPNFSMYGPVTHFGRGTWTQWEIYMSTGAANAGGKGQVEVWRNGVRIANQGGRNFVGSYDYSNATVQVGGVYTYLTWWLDRAHTRCPSPPKHTNYTTNYGDWSRPNPCPDQAPPDGHGIPFHRYFDDIIVLRK